MLQGQVHMAQFSVEIRHSVGSVLAEKQHGVALARKTGCPLTIRKIGRERLDAVYGYAS
jgi:hypothetical protein